MAIDTSGNIYVDPDVAITAIGVGAAGPGGGGFAITNGSLFQLPVGQEGAYFLVGGQGEEGAVALASGGRITMSSARGRADGTIVAIGIEGGTGTFDMRGGSTFSLTAEFVVGLGVGAGGTGTFVADASRVSLTTPDGVSLLSVGETGSEGSLTLTNGANLTQSGRLAGLSVGVGSGSEGTVLVEGGSSVRVRGSGEADSGLIAIALDRGSRGDMTVDGAGTSVLVAGIASVGYAFGGTTRAGTLTVSNGAVLDTYTVQVESNGALVLDGASIVTRPLGSDAGSGTVGVRGGMTLQGAGSEVRGDVLVSGSSFEAGNGLTFAVDANGDAPRLEIDGALDFGFSGAVNLDVDGYTFAAGETLQLATFEVDPDGPQGATVPGRSVGQAGQSASFSYLFEAPVTGTEGRLNFVALNDGDATERAVLRLGAGSTDAASFFDFDGQMTGSGGTYGAFSAFNIAGVEGTAAGDTFNLAFSTGGYTVSALGGDDRVIVGFGGVDANGGAGIDTLDFASSAGTSVTVDLSGSDTYVNFENVVTTSGDDVVVGSDAANTFTDRGGSDSYDGGAGRDTLVMSRASNVDLAVGTATQGDDVDTLTSIENVTGSGGDDVLAGDAIRNVLEGSAGADTLRGGGGNDVLRGGSGSDVLFGGDQNDILFGDGGADVLNGGRGFDYVSYTTSASGIVLDVLDAGANADADAGDAAGDRLQLIENLVGSNHDDTVLAGNVANEVLGRAGDDIIDGRGGADLIDGGAGADVLTGGQGFDTFRYQLAGESRVSAQDRITDFDRTFDVIDLSRIDADAGSAGDQAFTFVGQAAFTGTAGELRYGRGAENATIAADLDGDGRADFAVRLDGVTALTADDFVL